MGREVPCRDCKQPISFVKLESGKFCPVEPGGMQQWQVLFGTQRPKGGGKPVRLATDAGEVLRVWLVAKPPHDKAVEVTGAMVHGPVCPAHRPAPRRPAQRELGEEDEEEAPDPQWDQAQVVLRRWRQGELGFEAAAAEIERLYGPPEVPLLDPADVLAWEKRYFVHHAEDPGPAPVYTREGVRAEALGPEGWHEALTGGPRATTSGGGHSAGE